MAKRKKKPTEEIVLRTRDTLADLSLLTDIRELITAARQQTAQAVKQTAQAVNSTLVMMYWHIGRRIREDVLGNERAEYGKQICSTLSRELTEEFGRGFGRRNLEQMVRFAEVFPDQQIAQTLSAQLSWSHFTEIILSEDAGETWSAWQPSRFYGTLTMPTLYRLSDGRVLLLWCNTTPLPEIDRTDEPIPESAKNGRWEDVFTNRDACHAAISEDDGQTWIGFREMRLNPLRNSGDFGSRASHDFSVHQPQALELPKQCLDTNARPVTPESGTTQIPLTPHKSQSTSPPLSGKILVAHGQDEEVRALVIFDTKWLYKPRRHSTFENELADWSNQLRPFSGPG